ncbi:MAG: DUF4184 family protein [Bacteroidota bacterium]
MPFTPAHIAVVIPFRKWFRNPVYFTALVIGSIVPDMEYFLRFNPASGFSHTIRGIFMFDIPLTLLLLWLWNIYIRKSVINYFPFYRFSNTGSDSTSSKNIKNYLLIILCAFLGIITHLLWDGFTHGKGYFVQRISFLGEDVFSGYFRMKVCYLLWYVCSFIGTVIVVFYSFRIRKSKSVSEIKADQNISEFWSKTIFLTLMIGVIRIAMGLSHNIPRHLVIITIGAFIYSYCLIAFSESDWLNKNIPQQDNNLKS